MTVTYIPPGSNLKKEFKKTVEKMFENYPGMTPCKEVERVVFTEEDLKKLIDGKVLHVSYHNKKGKQSKGYTLGVNALPLISAWKTEELSRKIHNLTVFLIFLTVVLIILGIFR